VTSWTRARACLLMAVLASGCASAPPGPGNTVTLEPVSPAARSQRDAQLQGRAAAPPSRAPAGFAGAAAELPAGAVGQDATYTGGPVPAAVAPAPPLDSYEIVAPRPVPARPADTGPSVVAYALATTHPVGQAMHGRSGGSDDRRDRNCARYASDDLAQAAFLAAGGPERDPQGIDPDGDGYACGWDPERFRRAVQ